MVQTSKDGFLLVRQFESVLLHHLRVTRLVKVVFFFNLEKVVFFFNLGLAIQSFFVKMVDGILCLTSFHFLIEGGV